MRAQQRGELADRRRFGLELQHRPGRARLARLARARARPGAPGARASGPLRVPAGARPRHCGSMDRTRTSRCAIASATTNVTTAAAAGNGRDAEIGGGVTRRDGEHGRSGRDGGLARAQGAPLQRAGEIVGHDLKVGMPSRRPKPAGPALTPAARDTPSGASAGLTGATSAFALDRLGAARVAQDPEQHRLALADVTPARDRSWPLRPAPRPPAGRRGVRRARSGRVPRATVTASTPLWRSSGSPDARAGRRARNTRMPTPRSSSRGSRLELLRSLGSCRRASW